MKLNKIAFGIALAAGVGAAQADEVLFPYVVSSDTVTTILSVANTVDEGALNVEELHFRYYYKEGAAATDNAATCQEVNRRFTSSPNDLIDVSVDVRYGAATRGVLFNDHMVNATYLPATSSPGLLRNRTKPVRAFAIVDNNDGAVGRANDLSLVAGRATIIEFGAGAAWGYDAFNAKGTNNFIFDEAGERFGEVFSPVDFTTGNQTRRTEVSFKPFSEFVTTFYVTPVFSRAITAPGVAALVNATNLPSTNVPVNVSTVSTEAQPLVAGLAGAINGGTVGAAATTAVPAAVNQLTGSLRTRLVASVNGGDDVAYDRDELPVSGRAPKEITCVGAVRVQDLMSTGAADELASTGGWTMLSTTYPAAGAGFDRTPQATIMFLEHNAIGARTINGENAGGVINNGYQLRQE